jgi:hypothetical protein
MRGMREQRWILPTPEFWSRRPEAGARWKVFLVSVIAILAGLAGSAALGLHGIARVVAAGLVALAVGVVLAGLLEQRLRRRE